MSAAPPVEVEPISIAPREGRTLAATVMAGAGRVRGTALLVHALGAPPRGPFGRPEGGPARHVAGAGWRTVVVDVGARGGGPLGAPSRPWSFDAVVRGDLAAVGETLRERFDGPLALVGHGLGGLAACAAAAVGALDPDALVLFGVNVWLPRLDASPARRLAKAALLARGEGAAAALGRALAAPAWLRLRPEAARWWAEDAWLDGAGRDYLAGLGRLTCPTLAFSSRADRLACAPACAQAFVARVGSARLEHRVAPTALAPAPRRGPAADERAEAPWRESADWLARLAP